MMKRMAFIKNKILIVKILLSGICILFLAMTFHTENRSSGWYQQFLPNLNGKQINDITFLDSLTGYAVARQQLDSSYILKTTNGGDNWIIIFRNFLAMQKIQFLNLNTGYACGAYLFKTSNGGFNWNQVTAPTISPENMYILDENNIWIISSESLTGGVFYTSNGGLSWTQQFSAGTENPNKIYMFNARIGFIKNMNNSSSLKKTTNGGNNWFSISNEGFTDMYFIDSLIGWRAGDYIKKTTNGGLNWIQQQLPQGINGQTIVWGIRSLSKFSKDTLWGSYASVTFPNLQYRGILYRTTNGGTNWFYQIPDTTYHIPTYSFTFFLNNKTGWAYNVVMSGIHTTNGGDTTFYMGIQKISNEIPKDYILHQNYPNPFNPRTVIGYEIKKNSFVRLDVFDITGKEVAIMVNEKQNAGKYEVDFMGKFSPSGIYFYRLMADGKVIDTKKMLLVK